MDFTATYRLSLMRLRRVAENTRKNINGFLPSVLGLFEWKWGFPWLFLGLAVALIGVGLSVEPFDYLFGLARLLFSLTLISGIGWWLTSKQLKSRKPRLTRQQKKQGETLFGYRVWTWLPVLLMICLCAYTLALTNKIELSRELSLGYGWLVPADDPGPPNQCSIPKPPDSLTMYFGTNTIYATKFPHTVIGLHHHGDPPDKIDPKVILDRDKGGRLALTMDIFDDKGDIVAEIDRNHFTVNKNNFKIIHKNDDRSALSVFIPHNKEEVLDVRYLNPHSFQIAKAVLRFPGAPLIEVSDGQLRITPGGIMIASCLGSTFEADIVLEAN
jgi:hypothetical protein